ncbi:sodium-dependent glucose transporter 1B-like [Liolophura sinensis]|uniref:sodium-dependent glucose transporter 1B-like n=1 Tax=Liolophura sinensis TaxID=3198878 RepID=UPI003158E06C
MVDALEVTSESYNEPIVIVETDSEEIGRKKTIKLVYTFFILLVYFVGGALKGQEGVTFLDLLILTDSDMESGSLLLTCSALGFMLGPLLLGFLYDRYNNSGLFAIFIVSSGLLTYVIPWCHHLVLMSVAFVLRNLVTSAVDIGALVITVKLWKNEVNPYMQAIQAMFALGGIVSPLITAPFLSESGRKAANNLNNVKDNTSRPYDMGTSDMVNLSSQSVLTLSTNTSDNQTWTIFGKEETNVYIAYSIIATCMLVVSIPVAILWISRSVEKLTSRQDKEVSADEVKQPVIKARKHPRLLPVAIALVGLFFFVYGPVEKTCANFLLAFLVKQMNWSKVHAAQGNSAFYAGFAGGRFIGIALAVVMPTTLMLFVFMMALVVCLGLFILAIEQSAVFTWVCIVLIGTAMSTIYASMYAWVDVNVTSVTGKMASCMQVALALGTMATTPLIGYLFKEQTPMWFVYLTITLSSTCFLCYSFLYLLTLKFPLRLGANTPCPEKDTFLQGEDKDGEIPTKTSV